MNISSHYDIDGSACMRQPSKRQKGEDWTVGMVRKEVLKYGTRYAFQKGCGGAYQHASRHGFLDEICAHMPQRYRGIHTKESIHKTALDYSTRGAFAKGNQAAYAFATRYGFLNDVCSHMVSGYDKK